MGIWTGIKHALNSTLGTSEFKPLDQIIQEERDFAASDNLLRYVFTGSKSFSPQRTIDISKIKMHRNGSIRVKFEGRSITANVIGIRVVKSSNLSEINGKTMNTSSEDSEHFFDIIIEKDEEYILQAYTVYDSGRGSVQNLRLCGTELDLTGIEVIN